MRRFDGKVVVVTGAASGIGAAAASRFAAEGAAVVLADIADRPGGRLAEEITAGGGRACYVHCDVADERAWQRLHARTHEAFGPVDVVHSNAFVLIRSPAHDLAPADWDRQIAVNLRALYLAARTFIPDLSDRRGALVATSSVHAVAGLPGHPAYAAAKGGIGALVRQLAVEYGPRVRVNAVVPGPVTTPVWRDAAEAELRDTAGATALGRLGAPAEVAAAVAFLASAEASYITGAELLVDGGWVAKKDSR